MLIEEQAFEALDIQKTPLEKGNYEYCTFKDCQLSSSDLRDFAFVECEFVDCDLSKGKMIDCQLSLAVFDRTNLEKADMTGSDNYDINPENNKIKGLKVSADSIRGFLSPYGLKIID